MKKTAIIIMTAAAIAAFTAPITAHADDSIGVRFQIDTIDQNTNRPYTVAGKLSVSDINKDGKLTMEDALYCAHEQYYPGGAAAGLDSAYIWGVCSAYTATLFNQTGKIVCTSSGQPDCTPGEERDYLLAGDFLSWSSQWFLEEDAIYMTSEKLDHDKPSVVTVGEPINIQVHYRPRFKKDADRIKLKDMVVWACENDIYAHPDDNGDLAFVFTKAHPNDRLALYLPAKDEASIRDERPWSTYQCCVRENDKQMVACVEINNEPDAERPLFCNQIVLSECDTDGYYSAYDAICSAAKRDAGTESQINSLFNHSDNYTVSVNDGYAYPLSRASKLPVNLNDRVTVMPAAAASTTAVTTDTTAPKTTATAASTTTAQSAAGTTTSVSASAGAQSATTTKAAAAATKAATTTAGNVKTGDAMPIAALAFAGLAAGAAAVFTAAKRRGQ